VKDVDSILVLDAGEVKVFLPSPLCQLMERCIDGVGDQGAEEATAGLTHAPLRLPLVCIMRGVSGLVGSVHTLSRVPDLWGVTS
jgi:hypothetical protein